MDRTADVSLFVPPQLHSAVVALIEGYLVLHRDKTTARVTLELEVHAGGVRDRNLTTRTKI